MCELYLFVCVCAHVYVCRSKWDSEKYIWNSIPLVMNLNVCIKCEAQVVLRVSRCVRVFV